MQPVGLQEWIHKIEEGEGTKYLRFALAILALLGLAALWHIREARGFATIEAMDSAQVARNIARGQGFSTEFVRPISLALMEQHKGASPAYLNPHPDLANPPAYPLVLAGLMKALPFDWSIPPAYFWRYQPEVLIGWFNQLLFFASLFLVFRLGVRLFDKAVATLSVVLMALTEVYWEFTTSGLSTMLLIVLFLLLVHLLVIFDEGVRGGLKDAKWMLFLAAGAGLIVGVMMMTRYSMGWLILPVAGFLAFTAAGARPQVTVAAIAACALVAGPWLARNYRLSGTLFGTAGLAIHEETPGFPGFTLERAMPRNLSLELNKIDLQQYPRKLFLNGREMLMNDLPNAAGSWIAALFAASLLIQFRNPALARLKTFIGGTLLLYVIVQALGKTALSAPDSLLTQGGRVNSENLLVIFTPLFFLFGASLFYILLDQIEFSAPWLRSVSISSFVFLLSLPLVFKLLPPRTPPIAYPPYYPPMHQALAGWMSPRELIMSDIPWAVAWYGDRQSIWLTLDYGASSRDDFYHVNDDFKPVKALYLTEVTTDSKFLTQMHQAAKKPELREGIWGKFYLDAVLATNLPSGFPLKVATRSLLPEVFFLSDTEGRWNRPRPAEQKKEKK